MDLSKLCRHRSLYISKTLGHYAHHLDRDQRRPLKQPRKFASFNDKQSHIRGRLHCGRPRPAINQTHLPPKIAGA